MRMKLVTAFAVVVAAVAPLRAHHAFSAEFDVKQPITLKGTLVKWEMINPHSWFHIEVKNPSGEVVEWMIEGGSPNSLIRQGVTKLSLQIGAEVVSAALVIGAAEAIRLSLLAPRLRFCTR